MGSPVRSVGATKPHDASLSRLWVLPAATGPRQSPPAFCAMIVFFSVAGTELRRPPPWPAGALLAAIVLFVIVAGPLLLMPP